MCKKPNISNLEKLIDQSATLDDYRKELLKTRYIRMLREFSSRCKMYSYIFHFCRIIVTVGSLLVPALMSIQYSKDSLFTFTNTLEIPVYWSTWIISLLVTIANGIFTLFKIDKKYYFLHSVYEKLQSEGYQYLSLTGKFSGILNKVKKTPDHLNQFIYFCHSIEKIKLMQSYEEYFKLSEATVPSANNAPSEKPIQAAIPINNSSPQSPSKIAPDPNQYLYDDYQFKYMSPSMASNANVPSDYNQFVYGDGNPDSMISSIPYNRNYSKPIIHAKVYEQDDGSDLSGESRKTLPGSVKVYASSTRRVSTPKKENREEPHHMISSRSYVESDNESDKTSIISHNDNKNL